MAGAARQDALRASAVRRRTYDADGDAPLPDLTGLPGVDAVGPAHELQVDTMHVDTDDQRLRAAGVTLQHRSDGTDATWHLALPSGRGREELAVDGGPDEVPQVLAALVRARTRERPLVPVATVRARRVGHLLQDAGGTPLARVAQDEGDGRAPAGDAAEWRAWEVERLTGDDALLDAVEQRLLAAGARPASGSGVDRLLPGTPPVDGERPWWAGRRRRSRPTAGSAVQAHLAEQVAELLARDPQTRRDLPDGLHKMRVATRRLRSALTTFRPLLDRTRTDPLRDELRWLAGVLGAARDAEVMHDRLRQLVAAEPSDLVLGDVQDRIDVVMGQRHSDAHDQVLAELDGERYLRLLDALDDLVARPPFTPQARKDAAEVVPRLVRRTWRRLDRAMAAAEAAPRGAEQDELLHDVRKDAKRSRYAAEAVQPVFGSPAARFAAAVTDLQESLGDFQDGVVTRAVLRELGAEGDGVGHDGFTFGRLHALEQVKAEAAVAAWPQARAAVSKRRLRRWLED